MSRDLLNTMFILQNFKDDEFFMCAKFWFNAIIYAKVIANNSNAFSPRP